MATLFEKMPTSQRFAFGLLSALAWIRGNALMRTVYRVMPAAVRARLNARLTERAHARLRFTRNPRWEKQPATAHLVRPVAFSGGPGVNVFGYLSGEFGLGESARLYSRSLLDANVPCSFFNIDLALPHGMKDDSFADMLGDQAPHSSNLIFVNPDFLQQAMQNAGEGHFKGRRNIACWFWELPRIPLDWSPAIAQVDAILVASRFVEDAFRAVTDKPILRVPLPYYPGPDSGLARSDLGLQSDDFIFLCMFDFHSSVARKNPQAVIEAFKQAFPERKDVRLLIKSSNGSFHEQALRDLLALTANDSRIIVRDDVIDRAHVRALIRCCDVFVSLHRAEGFGLVMAEAMGLEKPVIATRWSGNLEFMTEKNSCLVDFKLRPVRAGEYPHVPGDEWAEPDVNHAAFFMRELAADHELRGRLGAAARQTVVSRLNPQAVGKMLVEQLGTLDRMAGSTS